MKSRRPEPNQKGFLTRGVMLLGMLAGLLFIYKTLATSPLFYASNLKVEGCQRLTVKEVMELGGISIYSNLLTVRSRKLEKRLVEHDWIESASVEKRYPDSLYVSVTERVPVAMVNLEGGLYYLDRCGVAFAPVEGGDDHDYPVISGLEGLRREQLRDSESLDEALEFLRYASLGDSRLPKQNVSELNLAAPGNIIIFLADRPFPIYLGRGEMRGKYNRLARVLYKLYKRELFYEAIYIRMDVADSEVLVGRVNSG